MKPGKLCFENVGKERKKERKKEAQLGSTI